MNVLTDNEKGLLVLEHLGPKALAHDTMSLLEAFELGLKVAEQEVIKRLAAGVSVEPVNNDLADDISAIDCMYRGDPSYEHDAYYMREQAVKLVRNGYMLVTLDQLTTAIAAARVQENERCARTLEAIGCQGYADALRALLGKEAQS